MARTGLMVAGVVAAIAVAMGVAWAVFLRDTAEPVTVDEAVTSFRTDTEPTPGAPSPIPEGVYVYATDGFERTDALTGVTHRYPRRSTITIRPDPCGVRVRWDVLEGRSTTWTYCIGLDGWRIRSQDERHTFFGRTERTTYRCFDYHFRPTGDDPGTTQPVVCSAGSTKEQGRGLVVGRDVLRVEGERVETVHLRKTSSFTGGTRGSTRHDLWFERSSGVPVKVVMRSDTTNDSPIGDVHYEEDVTLLLTSLTPRR